MHTLPYASAQQQAAAVSLCAATAWHRERQLSSSAQQYLHHTCVSHTICLYMSAGASLLLERLVLVGFDYAAPGGAAPVLWPAGLLQSSGSALNLTDVRLVTSSPDVFNVWLRFFTSDSRVAFWTVGVSSWTQQLSCGVSCNRARIC